MRLFRLLLALIAAVVTLTVLLELGAARVVELPQSITVPDARLNHAWPKGAVREHKEWANQAAEFSKPYTHYYNSAGFIRKTEITKDKPSGIYRIFYVGDSFIEGTAPMEDAVPAILERALNAAAGKERFEVINAGVMSYSPVLYYIWVRYYLMQYHPDLIVVNVDMTDVFDDWKYKSTLEVDAAGDPFACRPADLSDRAYLQTASGAVSLSPLGKLQFILYRNSYLYNLALNAASFLAEKNTVATETKASLHARGILAPFAWCDENWDKLTVESVNYSMDILRRLIRFCKSQNVDIILAGVPHYEQLARQSDGNTRWSLKPFAELRHLSEQEGITYLDSVSALTNSVTAKPREYYFYKGDMHFNPRGFKLWADVHLQALRQFLADHNFVTS